jgi:hypothetical protein
MRCSPNAGGSSRTAISCATENGASLGTCGVRNVPVHLPGGVARSAHSATGHSTGSAPLPGSSVFEGGRRSPEQRGRIPLNQPLERRRCSGDAGAPWAPQKAGVERMCPGTDRGSGLAGRPGEALFSKRRWVIAIGRLVRHRELRIPRDVPSLTNLRWRTADVSVALGPPIVKGGTPREARREKRTRK